MAGHSPELLQIRFTRCESCGDMGVPRNLGLCLKFGPFIGWEYRELHRNSPIFPCSKFPHAAPSDVLPWPAGISSPQGPLTPQISLHFSHVSEHLIWSRMRSGLHPPLATPGDQSCSPGLDTSRLHSGHNPIVPRPQVSSGGGFRGTSCPSSPNSPRPYFGFSVTGQPTRRPFDFAW